jgi:hypothetical protein
METLATYASYTYRDERSLRAAPTARETMKAGRDDLRYWNSLASV